MSKVKKPIISKILIITGLLVSINPYLILLIGAPIFLIGAMIYWTTKESTRSKLLWTISPIVIWYPLMIGTMFLVGKISTSLSQKRDYIVSEGFQGRIKIIESDCGQVPEVKNGRLQFVIPQSGVFPFAGELKSGYINEKYYVKRKNGELREIPKLDQIPQEKDTTGMERAIGVHLGGFGSYGKSESNFIEIYIETNKNYNEKTTWDSYKAQDKIIDSLRANCQKMKTNN